MSDKIHYLSDEELNSLIGSVESEPLIEAPANLDQKVIAAISSGERKKTVDFCKYCARVGFAVAAAIAIICIVPYIPEFKVEIPGKESVFVKTETPSREEVILSKATPSREEVLSAGKRTDYLEETEVFIQTHINSWFD